MASDLGGLEASSRFGKIYKGGKIVEEDERESKGLFSIITDTMDWNGG